MDKNDLIKECKEHSSGATSELARIAQETFEGSPEKESILNSLTYLKRNRYRRLKRKKKLR
jgi:hypothetical protein